MLDSLIKISSNYYRNKVCNNNVSYAIYFLITYIFISNVALLK